VNEFSAAPSPDALRPGERAVQVGAVLFGLGVVGVLCVLVPFAVNTVGFAYANEPIKVSRDETVRIYLVNITEFDPINSFHLHGNFFNYYDTGTSLEPTVFTDIVMQCQAQRGILEFDFKGYEPGLHMFHAHQTEFVELGWMGMFDVR
jgi:FtsP/CotA-like multicopper oxidase with cupredoxin domain